MKSKTDTTKLLNKLLERGAVELKGEAVIEPHPIWRLRHIDTSHDVGTPAFHEVVTDHRGRDLDEVLHRAIAVVYRDDTMPEKSARPVTTTVDITIRLQVVGDPRDVANCREALDCLADVMAVQAEDGLWRLGSPDAESNDVQNEFIADIPGALVQSVLIGAETECETLRARCARLAAIANELAAIASHAVHVPGETPGETTAMDRRIAALVADLGEDVP